MSKVRTRSTRGDRGYTWKIANVGLSSSGLDGSWPLLLTPFPLSSLEMGEAAIDGGRTGRLAAFALTPSALAL